MYMMDECLIRLLGVILILLFGLSNFYCRILLFFELTNENTCEKISTCIGYFQIFLKR